MPYRQIVPMIELVWRWVTVMWEPGLAYIIALGAALVAAGAGSNGHSLSDVQPIEAFGFIMGWVIDFGARGRVYGALPPDRRKSRWREMKERTLWSAIGLGTGAVLAFMVNQVLAITMASLAHAFAPFVNLVCVGVIALPFIDGSRGAMRMLSGQSKQEAFADLIFGWLARRAGVPPAPPSPASPSSNDTPHQPGGRGDA
ncbi:MAG: hypothetical protein ACXIVO_13645 [Glycocaulis sp.]